jgi:hypothetical protein
MKRKYYVSIYLVLLATVLIATYYQIVFFKMRSPFHYLPLTVIIITGIFSYLIKEKVTIED